MKRKKIKTPEMESAIATHFGIRANLIVPNISWGLGIHECDLLVLTASGYATEVEIKVSRGDLIKDKEKSHGHHSKKLKYLYFAIPDYLEDDIEHIPERAGILIVAWNKDGDYLHVRKKREPKLQFKYKFTDKERFEVARLGSMRIWGLKRTVNESNRNYHALLEKYKTLEKEEANLKAINKFYLIRKEQENGKLTESINQL